MRHVESAQRNTKSSGSWGSSRSRACFVLCVDNRNYPASLERWKVYQGFVDDQASRQGLMRVADESGEDYLYPQECFVPIKLPQAAKALLEAGLSKIDRRGASGGVMSDQNWNAELDNRCRDSNGEIRRKRSDTLVGTLRKEYGDDFAEGFRSDTKLGKVLRKTDSASLSDYLKRRR